MSTLRTALAAAGVGALALAAGTSAATAQPVQEDTPSFGYGVSPQSIEPGGAVELTVTGCTDYEATAESAIFERITLGMPGDLQSARTTVDPDARPGVQYDIAFVCGDETATASLTVVAASSATATTTATSTTAATAISTATATVSATSTVSATATATATAKPTLGAQAGAGGSQTSDSTGPAVLIAGAGLTLVAVAGATAFLRRRPRRHR